jgi:hypothetical protein
MDDGADVFPPPIRRHRARWLVGGEHGKLEEAGRVELEQPQAEMYEDPDEIWEECLLNSAA